MINRDNQTFVLSTENTSYIFRVMSTGQLEHLYYGRLIKHPDGDVLMQKRAFPPGNLISYTQDEQAVNLEDVSLEMSAYGKGDVREPFVEIRYANGSISSDFVFEDAVITDEKPAFKGLPGSYDESGGVEHLTVFMKDRNSGVTLELHYYVYPDCDVISRSARIVNGSGDRISLLRLMSTQVDFSYGQYSVTSFHGGWAREMDKSTVALPAGKYVNSSYTGTSSNRSNPLVIVHPAETTEESGDAFGFNLIYSGNHYTAAEVNSFHKTRVVSGINPQSFCFVLEPGDDFESPESVMTYSAGGFTGMSLNMHRFVREHIVRGYWKDRERPVLFNSWEAEYFDINEGSLLRMAKEAKDLGVELFVVDDGWFKGRNADNVALGDWVADPKKLPGGLKSLGGKLKEMGLDLGIWVEPEMVSVDSDLYRAHPEWAMDIPGAHHSEGRNQRILDLCNPEVVDFIIEAMSNVFSSADIKYVKWDMNRIFSDVYSKYLPPERQGEVFHRYMLGFYRAIATLEERFPEILFEGCASGGNRFDLGILCYFPQIWASDNTDPICRACIQEGYSYGYPMSVVSTHISASPNHQTLRKTPVYTRCAVAVFGQLGIECDPRDLPGDAKDFIREVVRLYKPWRNIVLKGDFYRSRTGNIHEWTIVSPTRKWAVGIILQEMVVPNSQQEYYRPKGLDEDKVYDIFNIETETDIRAFGSLINTQSPVRVRQDSLTHRVISRFVKLPGEKIAYRATGESLMRGGVNLPQAFSGTGYSGEVRYFQDFDSRIYFIQEAEPGEDDDHER
ncbi:MAG: alpha-galactosidase [Eubacterium sp.]|nr:alpha-galactosidase [Eubacterium sp.]